MVYFEHILIKQTGVLGIQDWVRMLYKTSLPTESQAFL